MKTSFRNSRFLAAAALMAVAFSASAGVVSTSSGTSYTASNNGDILSLTVDATGHKANLKNATELDTLTLTMSNLTGVTMLGASSSDWTYTFKDAKNSGADKATFTAVAKNHSLVSAPLTFSFEFLSDGKAPLDFNTLDLSASYMLSTGKLASDNNIRLNVTDLTPLPPVAAVPEPATFAMMGLGLGLVGVMRRRKTA